MYSLLIFQYIRMSENILIVLGYTVTYLRTSGVNRGAICSMPHPPKRLLQFVFKDLYYEVYKSK